MRFFPSLVFPLVAALLLLGHGPIAQPEAYHAFADAATRLGIPHAADVLSNLGFLLVGAAGLRCLHRERAALQQAWPAYAMFCIALALTAFGSAWYHWAPDNARLVWDRLPIALACAALLSGVRTQCFAPLAPRAELATLAALAVASVWWWQATDDLRPYLLLQAAPIALIPLWQRAARRPHLERLGCAAGLGLYLLAKAAELNDHLLLTLTGVCSGHTLKHLLAAAAAACIVWAMLAEPRGDSRRRTEIGS